MGTRWSGPSTGTGCGGSSGGSVWHIAVRRQGRDTVDCLGLSVGLGRHVVDCLGWSVDAVRSAEAAVRIVAWGGLEGRWRGLSHRPGRLRQVSWRGQARARSGPSGGSTPGSYGLAHRLVWTVGRCRCGSASRSVRRGAVMAWKVARCDVFLSWPGQSLDQERPGAE